MNSLINNSNLQWLFVTGKGGVGKTSIEIDFCLNNKMSFLTDDIAIGDVNGDVYPNYNWPKIYGYNLLGNKLLIDSCF